VTVQRVARVPAMELRPSAGAVCRERGAIARWPPRTGEATPGGARRLQSVNKSGALRAQSWICNLWMVYNLVDIVMHPVTWGMGTIYDPILKQSQVSDAHIDIIKDHFRSETTGLVKGAASAWRLDFAVRHGESRTPIR
jgi:hypothetical protein